MSIISVKDMCLWYGDHQALKNVNIEIPEKSITAFIGPSGCGNSPDNHEIEVQPEFSL